MARAVGWLRGLVVEGPFPPRRAIVYRLALVAAIMTTVVIAVLDTAPTLSVRSYLLVRVVEWGVLFVLLADYVLRLTVAWHTGGDRGTHPVLRYGLSAYGLFDLFAVVPLFAGSVLGLPQDAKTVFGILAVLKLARYSPALETLGAVVLSEFRPLMSALFIMMLLALFASTALYFVERDVNPGVGSVPEAMWWSVVTLATLGYGDVVPTTAMGKVLGAGVAILGLCMFALPASILASGFSEEMRRQNFVSTWHLVAKVPFFTRLQASQIAEIASLLKVYRAVQGEILMREGDLGETMYFIVSGQVEVQTRTGAFHLNAGDFFGEIALIKQVPRTATVKTCTRCQLLILDARDFNKFVAGYPALLDTIVETAQARLGSPTEVA